MTKNIRALVVRRKRQSSEGLLHHPLTGVFPLSRTVLFLADMLSPSSIQCGVRFQATDVSRGETTRTDKKEESQLWVIRNIHIKYLVRLACFPRPFSEVTHMFQNPRNQKHPGACLQITRVIRMMLTHLGLRCPEATHPGLARCCH